MLSHHLNEFKELGYTIFKAVFPLEQMQLWKSKYHDLVERQSPPGCSPPQSWLSSVVESEPRLMLPVVTHPTLLDFAERVLGPFVQLDNLTLMGFPSISKAEAAGQVSFWHRDRWGQLPEGPQYIRPLACNAITYLQDLTDEFGPLRVVEGSHRRSVSIAKENLTKPFAEETVLRVNAGDVVFTHCSLLHSGTPNTSGSLRFFLSVYYNMVGLRTTDNHSGPNVQSILKFASEKNDRRLMRLFGRDDQLAARANSGFMKPDEEIWEEWIKEDRAVLKA